MRGGGNMNRLLSLCFTSYGSKVGARHKRRVSEIHAVKTFLFFYFCFLLFFKFSKLNSSSRSIGVFKRKKFKRR